MPAILDTSVLVAAVTSREQRHRDSAGALLAASAEAVVLPVTILAEAMSLIRARQGVARQRGVWDQVMASGITIVEVDASLLARARAIDDGYADAGFRFADCTLLAVCEELRIARVLSLDGRLASYKPTFAASLQLLP